MTEEKNWPKKLSEIIKDEFKQEIRDWRSYVGRWTGITFLTAAIVGSGLGLAYLFSRPPKPPVPLERYEENDGNIRLFGCDVSGCRIRDFDRDGDADIIYSTFDDVLWADSSMVDTLEKSRFKLTSKTKFMTPEIKKYSTEFMKAEQNLRYHIDREDYRLWLEESLKEKNQK